MTDKKDIVKLICYRGDRAACWFYRLHIPMVHLARNNKDKFDITVSGTIGKDHIGKFDLAILQRQYNNDVLMPVLEMQKAGAKLIYEIDDDLFHIPKWNPAYGVLGKKAVQEGIKRFVSKVDAMFVTTEDLKTVYENYCEHIYVLPNSIEFEFIYPCVKNTVLPTVCWQGSMTHERDLTIAKKSFEKIAQNKDLLFKLWCGYKLNTRTPTFEVPGAHILPLTPFEGFFQMFGQVGVDIGLAPLATVPFNKSKSNLKFLEYTVYDAVTVASDFGPYRETIEDGVTGILVSDNRDWYDKVMMLLEDQAMYNTILTNAKELVTKNYDIRKNYIYWEKAIRQILGE